MIAKANIDIDLNNMAESLNNNDDFSCILNVPKIASDHKVKAFSIFTGLVFSRVQGAGGIVATKGKQKYVVTLNSSYSIKAFIGLMKKDNVDYDFYEYGIDENELIHKSKKPLWSVRKEGSTFILERS